MDARELVRINEITGTLIPTPGPNRALPPLNPMLARSTYAGLLTLIVGICTAYNIDLIGLATGLGFGTTEDEIIKTGERAVSAYQVLANIALGIWAWWERRAPNYRLSFKSH